MHWLAFVTDHESEIVSLTQPDYDEDELKFDLIAVSVNDIN